MAVGAEQHWAQLAQAKPFWVTEYGGNWNATSEPRLKADLHSGLWSTWLTNAVGTPLFWWYDYVDRRNLYSHYRAFSRFIRGEDRRGLKGQAAEVEVLGDSAGLKGLRYRWRRGAYAWVYDTRAMEELPEAGAPCHHEDVRLRLTGLENGRYQVEYWDTYTGQVVSKASVEVDANQGVDLQLPPFDNDLAIKVKWAGESSRAGFYGQPPPSLPPPQDPGRTPRP
jgi:hypothetical protein